MFVVGLLMVFPEVKWQQPLQLVPLPYMRAYIEAEGWQLKRKYEQPYQPATATDRLCRPPRYLSLVFYYLSL
jgi:hypothetical protein